MHFSFLAGTALVEEGQEEPKTEDLDTSSSKNNKNNRMPGNIVCGICGALRFYAFILQAKKFGTFSCEPCRKFISKTIKSCQNDDEDEELFPCLSGTGNCLVPPVLRLKKANSEKRCQACWLKLCLIGYTLEDNLYDKLRSRLPIVFHDLLPESSHKNEQILLPNRGEILEFNRQVVPLSRPLFEGFGDLDVNSTEKPEKKLAKSHVVIERLPNGWIKKAVKRLNGNRWDTYLITPDQKQLRSAPELKLYIAKSGAVIDANLVNFSLPKRTAKVDKKLGKRTLLETKESTEVTESLPDQEEKVDKTPAKAVVAESTPINTPKNTPMNTSTKKQGSSVKRNRNVIVLPKSSRREVKVPLKYRDEDDEQTSSKMTSSAAVTTTPKGPLKKQELAQQNQGN